VSKGLTILVDVDDVCAMLIPEWIRRYNNHDPGDPPLVAEQIMDWKFSCVPECNKSLLYSILTEPDLYDNILPYEGARTAVEVLRQLGHRVVFVTSCVVGTADNKVRWLQRWGFLPKEKMNKDFVVAHDKALIRGDLLVDDGMHNVDAFPGAAVLITRMHNASQRAQQNQYMRVRAPGLNRVPEIVNAAGMDNSHLVGAS
jgi:5'-nucleotidase